MVPPGRFVNRCASLKLSCCRSYDLVSRQEGSKILPILAAGIGAVICAARSATRTSCCGPPNPVPNGRSLTRQFAIADFDVSPDGKEIIFEPVQETSNIALIERVR